MEKPNLEVTSKKILKSLQLFHGMIKTTGSINVCLIENILSTKYKRYNRNFISKFPNPMRSTLHYLLSSRCAMTAEKYGKGAREEIEVNPVACDAEGIYIYLYMCVIHKYI